MFSLTGSMRKTGHDTYVFTGSKTTIKWLKRIFAFAHTVQAKTQGGTEKVAAPCRLSNSSPETFIFNKASGKNCGAHSKTPGKAKVSRSWSKISRRYATVTPKSNANQETVFFVRSSGQKRPTSASLIRKPRSHDAETSKPKTKQASAPPKVIPLSSDKQLPSSTTTLSSKSKLRKEKGEKQPADHASPRKANEEKRTKDHTPPHKGNGEKQMDYTQTRKGTGEQLSVDQTPPQIQQQKSEISRVKPGNPQKNSTVPTSQPSKRHSSSAVLNLPPQKAPSEKTSSATESSKPKIFKNPTLSRYHEPKVTAGLRCLAHPENITAETFRVLSAPFQRFLVQTHPEISLSCEHLLSNGGDETSEVLT